MVRVDNHVAENVLVPRDVLVRELIKFTARDEELENGELDVELPWDYKRLPVQRQEG